MVLTMVDEMTLVKTLEELLDVLAERTLDLVRLLDKLELLELPGMLALLEPEGQVPKLG